MIFEQLYELPYYGAVQINLIKVESAIFLFLFVLRGTCMYTLSTISEEPGISKLKIKMNEMILLYYL